MKMAVCKPHGQRKISGKNGGKEAGVEKHRLCGERNQGSDDRNTCWISSKWS